MWLNVIPAAYTAAFLVAMVLGYGNCRLAGSNVVRMGLAENKFKT